MDGEQLLETFGAALAGMAILAPAKKEAKDWESVTATVETVRFHGVDAIREAIRAATGSGWIETTDCVLLREGDENWRCPIGARAGSTADPDRLMPLSLEIALNDTSSLTLAHEHGDFWRGLKITEETDGDPLLARHEQRLSILDGRALGYRVYWHPGEARVCGARFTGFEAIWERTR